VTGYGLDGRDSNPGEGKPFLLSRADAHPASSAGGTMGDLLEVKRPRREVVHTPPSSAEVKNGGAIAPLAHGIMLN
jgi:hypothetical protein